MNEKKDEVIQEVDEKKVSDNSKEEFGNDEKSSEINEKKVEGHKNESSESNKKNEFVEKARENPWIVSSIILGILLLGFLFSGSGVTGSVITGGAIIDGTVISAKMAGEKIVDFANTQGAEVELIEVHEEGIFYEVVISIDGNELSLYVTKDGKFFTPSLIPLVEDEILDFIFNDNLEDSLVN